MKTNSTKIKNIETGSEKGLFSFNDYSLDNLEELCHHNTKTVREEFYDQVKRLAATFVLPEIEHTGPDENGSYHVIIRETAILKEK